MCALPLLAWLAACLPAPQDLAFERLTLATDFLCEGASFADLDRDGKQDVIAGPYWYRGPGFGERRELYPPRAFDPAGYSDNFFAFPHDFDGDGWTDVLFVGFPGEAAAWYENPRDPARHAGHWKRHLAFDHVDHESPAWADLTGDGTPELVFLSGGRLGWAGPDPSAPDRPWTFHALSEDLGLQRFTHGLGVGDLDGDARADVLLKDGWWQQPESLAGDPAWTHQPFVFSERHGGAQMLVLDVDGDGDADVVTSLAAHEFGLSWWEQVSRDGARDFVEHRIMDDEPADNADGVRFGELHALALADVDGDGLADLVTGKRWWSHGAAGDPDAGAVPAVVYAFRLTRPAPGEVRFVAELLDDGSGVGVQVVAGDVSGDGRVDVVIGNKQGTFVLRQTSGAPRPAGEPAPGERAPSETGRRPTDDDGRALNLDFERGDLSDWTSTGDAFAGQPVRGDTVSARGREPSRHRGGAWIGGYELHGDERTGTLTSAPFLVTEPWASFLIGGGSGEATRVELCRVDASGAATAFFRTSATDSESMQRVVVDLGAELGRRIAVRLVDEAEGGWGHVNFDDFLFHGSQPSFPLPPGLRPILPPDPVLHAGLGPAQALAAMDLPQGFRVELVASEPALHQPIALAIDWKGRLWVAEAYTYPVRADGPSFGGAGQDDILVLEDRDRDGSFEKRTVFARGLNLVSGLEVGFGGAWIGAAPELLFVPDRDDDLVPDGPPEVLLDGFGHEDTHETLNAFSWGPDGWLYGCHGVFTHSRVGRPGSADEQRVPLDAGVWRFHPLRREFEVFAWGTSNPWGVDFDARGQCFVTACVIPHLFHLAQGGRYLRQAGQHFDPYVFEDIGTIADHRHYLGDDPHAGNLRSSSAGGGHAHCGALIYQADAFPPEWRGRVLMNNIHGNRVNADELVRAGSGFVGRHAEDLLRANDAWFRGIALETGPDGAVYLIDWYDQQACHWTEPERWDRGNGRLYRIGYGPHRPRPVDLSALDDEELVRLQFHSNEWFARRARVLLQEHGPDAAVHAILRRILLAQGGEERLLRALWALHATRGLDERLALEVLASPHEYVRAWTVQCLLEEQSASGPVLDALGLLAMRDPSPVVRLYLASGLQRLPLAERFGIARPLVAHDDARDPNLPYLLWYGIEPLVAAFPEQALVLARESRIERLTRFVYRRAAAEELSRAHLVRALAAETEGPRRLLVLEELARALRDQRGLSAPPGWSALASTLLADPDARVGELALELSVAFGDALAFPSLRATVLDGSATRERRIEALEALVRGADEPDLRDEVGELALQVLSERELQGAALRALAAFPRPGTPSAILERYGGFAPEERRTALATLGAWTSGAHALLDAVASGRIAKSELSAFLLRDLRRRADPELEQRLDEVVGVVRAPDAGKETEIARWRAQLSDGVLGAPDLARGRAVYERTCMPCHTLFGQGGDLGPELTGANRSDLEYLLSNVIDPSGVVGNEYRATVAWLANGRIVSGVERARTATSVTLQTETERVTLALDEIDELELSPLSAMPEDQLAALAAEEVRDLFAYLQSPLQVALPATGAEAARFFDGRTLAGWSGDPALWTVENGEIVGRTTGLERNEFLRNELQLADFRLTLEVRLAGDQGNSGIQFRSRADAAGDVTGYQADIGPGWWGKLYEEHGRGLLVERGAGSVLLDGWNRYEIECRGDRVQTWLNGEPCVDLVDPAGARSGIVALQLHSGGPTELRVRVLGLELPAGAPGR